MFTLLKTLHVLLAVFLVGPLTMVPMTALRAIRRRDAAGLTGVARQTMIYGAGSVVVFLLGFGLVGLRPGRFSLADPWITISMTLYVIALVLVFALQVPDVRRAGKLIDSGVVDEPRSPETEAAPTPAGSEGEGTRTVEQTVTATATDLATTRRLDALYGRTAAVSGLVTLLFLAIIVLMVVQPFS